jgi:hypothetical protein
MARTKRASNTTKLMASMDIGTYDETRDLNFKVAAEFHRRFKIEAVKRGLSMREMLEQMAKDWWKEHPST